MSDFEEKNVTTDSASEVKAPKSMSRRAILRGGVTAMPAILTLHSGAALARSSNMISAAPSGTTDGLGRTMCVVESSVIPVGDKYDLGEPPSAKCNVIRGPAEREYFIDKDKNTAIMPGAMCENGGTYWFKPHGEQWQTSALDKGFVVSAGSIASVAEFVTDNLL